MFFLDYLIYLSIHLFFCVFGIYSLIHLFVHSFIEFSQNTDGRFQKVSCTLPLHVENEIKFLTKGSVLLLIIPVVPSLFLFLERGFCLIW